MKTAPATPARNAFQVQGLPRENAMKLSRLLAGLVACAGLVLPSVSGLLSAGGRRDASITSSHKCVHIREDRAAEVLKIHLGEALAGAKGGRLTLKVDQAPNTVRLRGPADLVGKAILLL